MVGGPATETSWRAGGAAPLEVDIDGMVDRYVQTRPTRNDRHDPVYIYDGMVNPNGAESGVENVKSRLASPAVRTPEPPKAVTDAT